MKQSEAARVWAEEMQIKTMYFKDGPFQGEHSYTDELRPIISRFILGGKRIAYYLVSDPTKDLQEYVYSIRKPE